MTLRLAHDSPTREVAVIRHTWPRGEVLIELVIEGASVLLAVPEARELYRRLGAREEVTSRDPAPPAPPNHVWR